MAASDVTSATLRYRRFLPAGKTAINMDPQRGVINSPVSSCIMFQYVEKLSPYHASDDKEVENKTSMMSMRCLTTEIKAQNYTQIIGIPHHVCDAFALQVD